MLVANCKLLQLYVALSAETVAIIISNKSMDAMNILLLPTLLLTFIVGFESRKRHVHQFVLSCCVVLQCKYM